MSTTESTKITPDMFQARDMNADAVTRVHSFEAMGPDGEDVDITFPKGKKWVPVPRAIGMKLAAIDGFEVRDNEGRPFSIKPGKVTTATVIHLAPDEVIARLDELTTAALAHRIKSATRFDPPKDAKREDMIAVLLQAAGSKPVDEADLTVRAA